MPAVPCHRRVPQGVGDFLRVDGLEIFLDGGFFLEIGQFVCSVERSRLTFPMMAQSEELSDVEGRTVSDEVVG